MMATNSWLFRMVFCQQNEGKTNYPLCLYLNKKFGHILYVCTCLSSHLATTRWWCFMSSAHTFGANFIIHTFFLQISFFLSSYVIPLALISILYVGMLIRLWHSAPGSKVSAESRRGKKRVTRMVVFVVLGEEVCIIIRLKLIFGFTLSLCNVLAANPRKWNFLIILISKRGDVSKHHNVNILSAFPHGDFSMKN